MHQLHSATCQELTTFGQKWSTTYLFFGDQYSTHIFASLAGVSIEQGSIRFNIYISFVIFLIKRQRDYPFSETLRRGSRGGGPRGPWPPSPQTNFPPNNLRQHNSQARIQGGGARGPYPPPPPTKSWIRLWPFPRPTDSGKACWVRSVRSVAILALLTLPIPIIYNVTIL